MVSDAGGDLLTADNYDEGEELFALVEFWSKSELRPHQPTERQTHALLLAWLLDWRSEIEDTLCLDAIRAFDESMNLEDSKVSDQIMQAVEERHEGESERRYTRISPKLGQYRRILTATHALLQPDLTTHDQWAEQIVLLTLHGSGDHQPYIFRDLFPNPFRPVAFDPSWRTPTVTALADAIYADRAWDRMPVLADALEEAGCGDARVLDHCRHYPVHARGCWVVDAVLGKT